jgi:hypothetical protein
VLSQLGSMLPSFVGDAVSHRLGMSKLNIARAPTQSRLYYAHGTFRVGCVPPTVTHSCLLPTWFSYACHGGFLVLEWITPRFACLQETKIQHINTFKATTFLPRPLLRLPPVHWQTCRDTDHKCGRGRLALVPEVPRTILRHPHRLRPADRMIPLFCIFQIYEIN